MRLAPIKFHMRQGRLLSRLRKKHVELTREVAVQRRNWRIMVDRYNVEAGRVRALERVILSTVFEPMAHYHGNKLSRGIIRTAVEKAELVHGFDISRGGVYKFEIRVPLHSVAWVVTLGDLRQAVPRAETLELAEKYATYHVDI